MKKIITVLLALSVVLTVLCGCDPKDKGPEIAGKTFYNTASHYEGSGHSKLWLGKDGSFSLSDACQNGSEQFTGTWTQEEDVLTLKVSETGSDVKFQIDDENRLVLKSGLLNGSKFDDVFTTEEPKEETVEKNEYERFYNASQEGSQNVSYLDIDFKKSVFVLVDRNDFGISEYEGTCSFYEDVITLHCKDGQEFYFIWVGPDAPDAMFLDVDLGISMMGDVFSKDGKIPEAIKDSLTKTTKWINYTVLDMTGSEAYLPYLELNSDGTFVLTENLFAGMGHYRGWYEEVPNVGYVCHVEDDSELQGFMGYGVTTIKFSLNDGSTIVLMNDLCMSESGNVFTLEGQ